MQFQPSQFSTSLALSNGQAATDATLIRTRQIKSLDDYIKLAQDFMRTALLLGPKPDAAQTIAELGVAVTSDIPKQIKDLKAGKTVPNINTARRVRQMPVTIENRYKLLMSMGQELFPYKTLYESAVELEKANLNSDGLGPAQSAVKTQYVDPKKKAAEEYNKSHPQVLAKEEDRVTSSSARQAIVAELEKMYGPYDSRTMKGRTVKGSGGYTYFQDQSNVYIVGRPPKQSRTTGGAKGRASEPVTQEPVNREPQTVETPDGQELKTETKPEEGKGINWWLVAGIGVPLVFGVAAIVYFRTSKSESPSLPLVPAPA